jgi:2-oxoglutarate dehydrogenase E2 component (dihydrolipoamide succinyltransferase)
MATIEILLPKMGESVAEATITKLVVSKSGFVESDEPLVEIATDKVDSEVPAPEDGTLVEWLVAEGDVVAVGQAIALFEIGGEGVSEGTKEEAPVLIETVPQPLETERIEVAIPSPEVIASLSAPLDEMPSRTGASGRFYSPLVRSIAKSEGISTAELDSISGSGAEGRVSKKDILAHLAQRTMASPALESHESARVDSPAPKANQVHNPNLTSATTAPTVVSSGQDEIIEMDRMRKMISDHMVRSVQTSPHVTSFVEADMTRIVQWRNKHKAGFLQAHGTKLTFTPLIAEAIVKAIRDFPGVNASVDGDRIVIKKQINLGMAAALPSGNLIVPVIKNADQLSLVGLAQQVNDLAERARMGKLKPDDTAGGTYTMSNVGTFGNVMGTPIINQPQVAILALGAIRKKPAVLETPDGDVIAIRHMMFLSHSYDHRVVDGMLGGSFIRKVADYLEAFDSNRPLI